MDFKKIWHFIWEEDSFASWTVNVIIAFILIKFIIYPVLGLVLATSHPIVAVVSESMEHHTTKEYQYTIKLGADLTKTSTTEKTWTGKYLLCGKQFDKKQSIKFDDFWTHCGTWYNNKNITKKEFRNFKMKNGFNKGDIIFLYSKKNIKLGDIIVFWSQEKGNSNLIPIIHRVVEINKEKYTTKGDHNPKSLNVEININKDRVIGKALFKIPYLGWIKIWFVDLINLIKG